MVRVLSARTENINNAYTDSLPKVWHIVTVKVADEMFNIRHYSSDPGSAIDEVKNMPLEFIELLRTKY